MADTKLSDLSEISILDLADLLYVVNDTGPASGKVSGTRVVGLVNRDICRGRLTLTTGLPVTTADVTAASTLYWTPIDSGLISLFDGTRWVAYVQAELSLALSGLTADRLYDVFLDYNAGTPALALGPIWTNDTTRGTGLTTQNGISVLSGTTTKRYVGTIRTTGTTTTEDSKVKRFVWNKYQQALREMSTGQLGSSHTYGTAAWREWAAGTGSTRLGFVCGEAATNFMQQMVEMSSVAGNAGFAGQGVDVTNAPYGIYSGGAGLSSARQGVGTAFAVAAGYHFIVIVQYGNVTSAPTFVTYWNNAAIYA